ncbi:MAG: glucose-1-phosphate thymidylyltransferase [Candidatus Woesebacteria bacterium]|jgi:glucose-1-phosphate thymidylyltransferase
MKAVIPTGGRGTRMQPLTFSTNKHFIPVANKPLIFYPIEAIAEVGIKDVAVTYNPGWLKYVKKILGTGRKWGLKFTYVLQEKPLGLANIFQVCEDYLDGDRFVMHLGDNIFTEGIGELTRYFLKEKPNGLVAKVHHPENTRMGVPYFDRKGRLKKYVEKPKNPPHDYAIPGIYFFDKNVFKCFKGKNKIKPSDRGEYEINSPYQWLIDNGYRVDVVEYEGRWLDPGKFDDWIEANRFLLDKNSNGELKSKPDKNSRIEGRVSIGRGCRIKNTEIRGPVSIADKVKINDSYIGPYTSISGNCIVENSHVENSVLMGGVVIKNIKQPINESLIGTQAEIVDEDGPTDWVKLFVGEKSRVKI